MDQIAKKKKKKRESIIKLISLACNMDSVTYVGVPVVAQWKLT